MIKYLTSVFLLMVALTSCSKPDIKKGTPDCVKDKINTFDREITCSDGVNVTEYTFQNKTVYVFNPGTCGADMSSEVIDTDCNTIGYLGGFSGNMIINNEDFSNAMYKGIIWEK